MRNGLPAVAENDMGEKKRYSGGFEAYEAKLKTVMGRIGVEKYNYDWTRTSCFVELIVKGRAFRFADSLEDARKRGERIIWVSDLFARIVLMLEDLARASERGIYDFTQILSGLPSLPEAAAELEPCFCAMGFSQRPKSAEEIRERYRKLAKVLHPDAGGDPGAFETLQDNYARCLEEMQNHGG